MHCFLNPPRGLGEFSQDKLLPGSQLPSPSTALLRNWDRPLEDRVGPAANTPGPRTSPPNDATARDYISGVLTAQEGFPGGRDSGLGKPHKQRCGVWNLESDLLLNWQGLGQGSHGEKPTRCRSRCLRVRNRANIKQMCPVFTCLRTWKARDELNSLSGCVSTDVASCVYMHAPWSPSVSGCTRQPCGRPSGAWDCWDGEAQDAEEDQSGASGRGP